MGYYSQWLESKRRPKPEPPISTPWRIGCGDQSLPCRSLARAFPPLPEDSPQACELERLQLDPEAEGLRLRLQVLRRGGGQA